MVIRKKNQLVGLDLGSHAIKMVEIEHSKRGRILKNFGLISVPALAIVEGSIREQDAIVDALKRLFKHLNIGNRNVAISLSGYSVLTKKIELGKMAEKELEKAIQGEAEKYIPFDMEDVNIDFDVLPPPKPGNPEKEAASEVSTAPQDQTDILLVAAKRSVIDEYMALFDVADLNPCVLDVDTFALQNAVEMAMGEPEENYVIVSLGASELGINAICRGISVFTRDSSFGGAQLDESIMSKFDVERDKAEAIKLGLDKTYLQGAFRADLEKIFTSYATDWTREIKQALDFIASTFPNEPIQRIVMAGGSSTLPGLQQYVEKETGVPVTQINPFNNLIIEEKRFDLEYLRAMAPLAGVAVGLALRSIGDK